MGIIALILKFPFSIVNLTDLKECRKWQDGAAEFVVMSMTKRSKVLLLNNSQNSGDAPSVTHLRINLLKYLNRFSFLFVIEREI